MMQRGDDDDQSTLRCYEALVRDVSVMSMMTSLMNTMTP